MTSKDLEYLPNHVAIIMDGNGRWARERDLERTEGHLEGLERVRELVEHSVKVGVKFLTLFAFSSENWKRPESEVSYLLDLFVRAIENEANQLKESGVRLAFIGDLEAFPNELREKIRLVEKSSSPNPKLLLTIAANYGGRWDIMQATQKVCESVAKGVIRPEQVTIDIIARKMSLSEIPEPDLLIRTGGEKRLSNYLLWQLAYTELYFTEKYWPDFDVSAFEGALLAYSVRERRFGKTHEQIHSKDVEPLSSANISKRSTW